MNTLHSAQSKSREMKEPKQTLDTRKLFWMFNLLITCCALLITLVDYFFTNEFYMESIYVWMVSLILGANLIRLFRRNLKSNLALAIAINVLILLFVIYNLTVLFFLAWGYSFTGTNPPAIWIFAALVNLGLIVSVMEDFYFIGKPPESKI